MRGSKLEKENLKKQRIKVLKKIDRIIGNCDCFYSDKKRDCATCEELKIYGNELMTLTSNRVLLNNNNINLVKPRKDLSLKKAMNTLDIETYIKAKKGCKSDKEVASKCGVSYAFLRRWKRVMGITKEYNRKSK